MYHALDRATARLKLCRKPADCAAFLRVLLKPLDHLLRLLGYCIMPTPWSSLACRLAGRDVPLRRLHPRPVALAANWVPWATGN